MLLHPTLGGRQPHRRDRARAARKIATAVTGKLATGIIPDNVHMDCHFAAHKAYISKCAEWTTGSLKHSGTLAELCGATGGDSRAIVAAITEVCAH